MADEMITPSLAGTALGFTAMRITKNPVVGIGVGLLTTGVTFFGKAAYQQYQADQREDLKQLFLDLLNDNQHLKTIDKVRPKR